ncbi:pitrilysin [Candidatus Profftia lariciata]|uniref:pitrilysin n=1 Tax=Candidatus Profftia lariciata TaxID=1987921 RepID=UPI003B968713
MHKKLQYWIIIILLFMSTSFFWSMINFNNNQHYGWKPLSQSINQSVNDSRLYKAIKLDNGMQVLLIFDKYATKSLAALALPVGSLEDPNSQLGLAHYLEHLVLMGSKKYPQSDSFPEFLKKHGGRYNASTASYRTAFYLEVENDGLLQAVDRLADAIAAPLLDPVYSDLERNAIHAELTMDRSRDIIRMAQISAETINPAHPSARFSGGNKYTLSDKPNSNLNQERLLFYHRYYSANLMVGVIYSNQPLNKLAKLAVNSLGHIPNRNASIPSITEPVVTPAQQGIIIHYLPAQPCKTLRIEYRIKNNSAAFRSKTDMYIAYLISNCSQNTLADWLQKNRLAESIIAGCDPMVDRNGGIFFINVSLTDQGLSERDRVISAIYSYLKLLCDRGVQQIYFNEIAHVLDVDFNYPSIIHDMDYIESLVDNMLRVPLKNILDSSYIADVYDPKAIITRLHSMTPENARIWFISPNEPHNKIAYFVEAPYQVERITSKQFNHWSHVSKHIILSLPKLNPYIPNDFSLMHNHLVKTLKPTMVLNEKTLRVLYMQSHYFANEPKVNIILSLRNKIGYKSIKEHVMFSLMDYIASITLNQLVYQASIGGIEFATSYKDGLIIKTSGFTQYLPQLFMMFIKRYNDFNITKEQLEQAKSWYRNQLDAARQNKAFEQAMQPIQELSMIPCVQHSKQYLLLYKITLNDIKNYHNLLIKESTPEMLVVGNINLMQVKVIAQDIRAYLKCNGRMWWHSQNIVLKHKQLANLQIKGSSTDSALFAGYIPLEYDEFQGMAHSNLLSQIIQPWFYDQLRTKEQLGYAIFSYPLCIGNRWGIGFLLQSNHESPEYLYNRYLEFYNKVDKRLKILKEKDFNQYKFSLLSQLHRHPQTLNEESARLFNDFNHGNFEFNSRENLMKYIAKLTSQDIIRFYHRAVMEYQGVALLSQVLGKHARGYYATPKHWITYASTVELQKNWL